MAKRDGVHIDLLSTPNDSSFPLSLQAAASLLNLTGIVRYRTPFASAAGNLPARMLTWMDGRRSRGADSFASRAVRIATKSSSDTPAFT